jgi:cell wall-associated NlpC family hydrolase
MAAPAADPVARFLIDKGLLSPSAAALPGESAFVARLRDRASEMVLTAMNFLGVPYRRGGTNADQGFDCSGFTRHVFESSLGLLLPRRADEQATTAGLLNINRHELKPGDLVFFNTLRRTFSHVGIYVGDGRFIHAPRPGGEVRVEDMGGSYWSTRFTGARRADPGPDGLPTTPSAGAEAAVATPPLATLRNVY